MGFTRSGSERAVVVLSLGDGIQSKLGIVVGSLLSGDGDLPQ
jgi:hypothetical protein